MNSTLLRTSVLALALAASAVAQQPHFTFASRMTTDTGGGPQTTDERIYQLGSRIRLETSSSRVPSISGMYVVFNGQDSSALTVMPSQQMAMLLRMPSIFGGMTKPVVSAQNNETVDLGAGEPILGFATHHYRREMRGTMQVTFGSDVCTRSMYMNMEVWTTIDTSVGSAMMSAMKSMSSGISSMIGGLPFQGSSSTAAFDSIAKTKPTGFPLRTVMEDSTPTGHTRRTTMEITEFSTATPDSALFAAPAGFNVQDMRGMQIPMPDMSAAMKKAWGECHPK